MMTFDELLTSVVDLLRRQGRVSYGALKRRFGLDDAYLQDLKDELIAAQRLAVDERGKILVWVGKLGKAETEKRGNEENQFGVRSSESSHPPALPILDAERGTRNAGQISGERRPLDRVTATHSSSPRAETSTRGTTLPLIGREEELHLFLKRWEQVQEGYGQVVLLSGEAGIGKSRLLSEVWNRLATLEGNRFVLRCSPHHQQSAFYPLLDLSQRTLQFNPGDSPQEKHRKLARALGAFHLEEALPLLATFLGLPTPQVSFVHLSHQKQREAVMQVVVRSWMTVAERQPLFIVWEDVQWADPSTLDLLQLFIDQIPTARILMVVTFRPDFTPPWRSRSYVTPLMLDRLSREQVQTMIQAVAEQKVLPTPVVQEIIGKTDGVPLFVEELTKMVLESGLLLAQEGRYLLKGPLPPLAIPTTLHDSLLARLDRLGEAREIAQLGSIFGREFSSSLLKAVTTIDEDTLQQALAKLVQAEVLYRRGVEPQVQYVFKHALIQEAAYQSLLKSQRQQYHQRVAQMFARSPEIQRGQPELLAHHYTEAGLPSYALRYWQRAGQNAIERSAFAEAVGYLTKGRTVLSLLPNTPERVPQEIELSIALGSALMAPKGYAAPEVEQTYAHALALSRQIGETPRLLQALSGLTVFYLTRGEIQTARELGAQCLGLAQQEQHPIRLLQALVVLGNVLFYAGEFRASLERLREGLALYNSIPQDSQRALQDPGVNSLAYIALALWCLGYPDQAVQQSDAALALARKLNRPLNHVLARVLAAGLYQFRHEAPLAFTHAETALALASEQEFAQWAAYGMIFRGWALAAQGGAEEGRHFILQGIAKTRDMGAEVAHPWILAMLADVCLRAHRLEEGLTVVGDALEAVQRRGEGMCEAELYRLRGELLLTQESQKSKIKNQKQFSVVSSQLSVPSPQPLTPNPSEAEADFLRAIAVAGRQQAKMWELRATLSLARLWQSQGKYHAARNMLSEISHWFTEGAETADLQEAKALLMTLRETSENGAQA